MKVTVRVHGPLPTDHKAWAMAIDTQTEDKVPFNNGSKDICLGSGDDASVATVELPEGADLIVYTLKDADAKEQDAYLRTGAQS